MKMFKKISMVDPNSGRYQKIQKIGRTGQIIWSSFLMLEISKNNINIFICLKFNKTLRLFFYFFPLVFNKH